MPPKSKKAARVHLSATRIKTFDMCARKWSVFNIRGFDGGPPVKQPTSEALRFGSAYHLELENWLRDGTPPDQSTLEGRTAAATIKHLPTPGTPGLFIERPFESVIAGETLTGTADCCLLYTSDAADE